MQIKSENTAKKPEKCSKSLIFKIRVLISVSNTYTHVSILTPTKDNYIIVKTFKDHQLKDQISNYIPV